MDDYVEHDVTTDAIPVFEECLRDGSTLLKMVANSRVIHRGRVIAYLPASLREDWKLRFTCGYGATSAWRTTDWAVEHIERYLTTGVGRIVVSEEYWGTSCPDPSTRKWATRIRTFGKEMYHITEATDLSNPEYVRDVIREATSLPFFPSVFTETGTSCVSPMPTQSFSREQLMYMASAAKHILIRAYDLEGYLLWSDTA